MIIVYVWLPKRVGEQKNKAGHSSMKVGEHDYVSWWPDEAAGFGKDYHPIRNKTYSSDVRDEAGQPDWSIDLNGLNGFSYQVPSM